MVPKQSLYVLKARCRCGNGRRLKAAGPYKAARMGKARIEQSIGCPPYLKLDAVRRIVYQNVG